MVHLLLEILWFHFQDVLVLELIFLGRYGAGSSREFSGFDTTHNFEAIAGILNRASKFLPALREISVQCVLEEETIRTGLRPYGQFLYYLSP